MDYLYALQTLREASPAALNYFFLIISEVILKCGILLIAVIYWCLSKRDGLAIGFGYVTAFSLNQTVKNIACVPRPWLRDSRLHVEPLAQKGATGFSFPSGHTVTAGSVFGGIAVWQKKRRLLRFLSILVIFLTAFSRNWLGCHTLADVIAALFISAVSLILVNLAVLWFSRHQDKDILLCVFVCAVSALVLTCLALKPYAEENSFPLVTDCFTACGMTCGMMCGWVLEKRFVNFSMEVSRKRRIIRGTVGVIIVAALYFSGSALFGFLGAHFSHLVKYFLIFFTIVFLYPLIFTLVERHRPPEKNAEHIPFQTQK